MKLAIVTAFWNPNESANVELAFSAYCRGMAQHREHLRIKDFHDSQLIWQKESMLNSIIGKLPDSYDAVAWVDADIQFLRHDWYEATIAKLEKYPVVQLFERCHLLDSTGRIESTKEGYVFQLREKEPKGGQGYAWAMHREVWEAGRLFDLHIAGGGDAMMAAMWMNRTGDLAVRAVSGHLRAKLFAWATKQSEIVQENVGHLEGDIVHFYHGTIENRRYRERSELLRIHKFDPDRDIERDSDGLLKWTGKNPQLEAAVKEMFLARKEDE